MTRSRFSIASGRQFDFRGPFAFAAAAALLLGLGACSDNRPFERESNAAQARLAVPSSLTPPISVQDVDGAPAPGVVLGLGVRPLVEPEREALARLHYAPHLVGGLADTP